MTQERILSLKVGGIIGGVSWHSTKQLYEYINARVAEEKGGAIPVLPLTDSLRQIFPDKSSKAVDRTAFVAVQTPQTFRVEEIKKAYKLPYNDTFTDDASVYEAAGYIPELVEGNRENLKITLPVDLAIAEIGLKE